MAWSGQYDVAALSDFDEECFLRGETSVERMAYVHHATNVMFIPGEWRFPLRQRYADANRTLQGGHEARAQVRALRLWGAPRPDLDHQDSDDDLDRDGGPGGSPTAAEGSGEGVVAPEPSDSSEARTPPGGSAVPPGTVLDDG